MLSPTANTCKVQLNDTPTRDIILEQLDIQTHTLADGCLGALQLFNLERLLNPLDQQEHIPSRAECGQMQRLQLQAAAARYYRGSIPSVDHAQAP